MTCRVSSLTFEDFTSVHSDWLDLQAESRESFVFNFPIFKSAWWDIFGQGELAIATHWNECRATLIAPLYVLDGDVRFIGSEDLFDYNDFIYSAGQSDLELEGMIGAVLDYIIHMKEVERFSFISLPALSPTVKALVTMSEKRGWRVSVEEEDSAPRIELPADKDAYLKMLNKKNRHELKRKMRRLENSGSVLFEEFAKPDEIQAEMDDFFVLHRMSTREKERFLTPIRERFFRRIMSDMARSGAVRLYFLSVNSVRTAVSLCFVSDGVKYLYNSGYNPDYGNLAVGLMNHALNIWGSIRDGYTVFDFLRGNETYKSRLGGVPAPIMRISIDI